MEDVIEELLQEEIYDEADVSRTNMGRRLQLAKAILNTKLVSFSLGTFAYTEAVFFLASAAFGCTTNRLSRSTSRIPQKTVSASSHEYRR